MWAVISRVVLYVAVVVLPVVMSGFLPADHDPFLTELATRLALLGFSILAMQFVLSARIKWVERPFGLDQIFRFHKAMAVVAACALLLHPVLIAVSRGSLVLITSFNLPAPIIVGKLALLLLVVLAIVSICRKALRLEYQKWLILHNVAAIAVIGLGFFHANYFSAELEEPTTRLVIGAILILGAIAYIKHTFIDPMRARKRVFNVVNVKQETHNVWTLDLVPTEGVDIPAYLPGQFHFIKLYRKQNKKVEEHPFTISSSPTQEGYIQSTIKSSGDYTSTIDTTQAGDTAAIEGPFGRFSYVLYPDEKDLVFISGGIGITPHISMLRHMRDTKADVDVHMLCFNRTERDIVFRDELAEIESSEYPKLNVTHVFSTLNSSWQRGNEYPNKDMIERLLGDEIASKVYYVCGPPPMMKIVINALRDLGVSGSNIRYENFAL